MNKGKPSLGRGLDALIRPHGFVHKDNEPADYSNVKKDEGKEYDVLAKVSVNSITPNPYQPRHSFSPEAFEELKKSILSNGLIQPITVRRKDQGSYELISGERRLKACKDIGYRDIPAYIIKVDSEEAMLAMALIENIQRELLNPIEIGMAYRRLMDECGLTQEQIANRVGKDRSTIANSIRLLKLSKEIQESLIKEEISSGHARALINLPSESMQLYVLKKIKQSNLSVRKVEQLVKKLLTPQDAKKKITHSLPKNSSFDSNLANLEDKLRKVLGTKVTCRQKNDGSGELVIEFYSNEELERLFELFEIIDKSYN
jgi:ParB family transcriptional regulator, chromosome partitioning protein